MTKSGLDGDSAAARSTMAAIEGARACRGRRDAPDLKIVWRVVEPGSLNPAMCPLRMATKLDPFRDTARMALEPWLVEASLSRLGDRQLTMDEQTKVVKATRTPRKACWPDWWQVRV